MYLSNLYIKDFVGDGLDSNAFSSIEVGAGRESSAGESASAHTQREALQWTRPYAAQDPGQNVAGANKCRAQRNRSLQPEEEEARQHGVVRAAQARARSGVRSAAARDGQLSV